MDNTRVYPCKGFKVSFSHYQTDKAMNENWPMIEPVTIVKETDKSFTILTPRGNKECDHKCVAQRNNYAFVYTLDEAKTLAMDKLEQRINDLGERLSNANTNYQWVCDYGH